VVKRLCLVAAVALGACGSFEDPQIILDLRYVAMTAEPPEQVFPLDLENPPDSIDDLEIEDFTVCARVADPAVERRLDYVMRVCGRTDSRRCDDPERPSFEVARGTIDDPETASEPQLACATVPADAGFLVVLQDALEDDPLAGFSGIDVVVDIEVTPADEGEAPIFGSKRVRFAAKIPEARLANTNPTVSSIDIVVEGGDPVPLPLGRCADQDEPVHIVRGEQLRLIPVEPEGVREPYVVPTLDGGERSFVETLRYGWYATDGGWTRGETGGERDASGRFPPLDTKWEAPDDIEEPTEVSLWMVQHDERLGVAWFESCVVVDP
jgi:hypothetical protein